MSQLCLKNMNKYILSTFLIILTGCSGSPNKESIGLIENKLHLCPPKDNCISSFDKREKYFISPISINDDSKQKLINYLENTERVRIVEKTDNYILAEFTSLIFRFVDDVEFYFDDSQRLLYFRSASRIGHSDLGANRKRINKILEVISN